MLSRSVPIRLIGTAALCAAYAFAQPPHTCDARGSGAVGDGKTLDTAAMQRAIDACATAGGGTVYVGPGRYLSGTLLLKDNITLWLDAGATIVGTPDLTQYRTAVNGQVWYDALILAKGVHHVAVEGRGVLDGGKVRNPKGEERMRGPHIAMFMDTRDVVVRDITLQAAGNYNIIVRSSERLNIDGVTVRGGWDGVNMHDSRDVTISNCHIYSGDDSLAGANWENVTVSNCVLNSSANTIRAGGRNVLFTNLVMYGPGEFPAGTSQRHRLEAGFQILPNRAPAPGEKRLVTPGPIDNMVLSNITMINTGTPIFIAYSADASYSANNLGVGRITFNNVTISGAGPTPIYISAPPENPAEAIVLNNVRVRVKGGLTESDAEQQGYSPFSILQSYGVYGRNVRQLELHDVRFDADRPDSRSAIFGENIGVLELDRFQAPGAVQLTGAGRVIIDGKPAPVAEAAVTGVTAPTSVYTGEPFEVVVTVRNGAEAGFANVALDAGGEALRRRVWLGAGESASVRFLNLKRRDAGPVSLRCGAIVKTVAVSKREVHAVAEPFREFHNTTTETWQSGNTFYIRAAGDFPLQQFGDQYGTIYRPRALGEDGAVVVKLENPDLRSNWVGRAGIVVRNDLTKPGVATGYLILATSPAAGVSMEWDGDGDGRLDRHTPFDGNTVWPVWIKLERHGSHFTGYYSGDGAAWTKLASADLPSASPTVDAGMFAYRSSARFEDWQLKAQQH
jgi:hypothetical protein